MTAFCRNSRLPLLSQVVIFLAGFTFLIYEVSWNRLLSLVLGSTVTATTVVLAAFMAGFGAGAWYWGRAACRTSRGHVLLAALLAGIGILSTVDYYLVSSSLPQLYAILPPGVFGEWTVFLTAAALLATPAFLMGGVFPLVSQLSVRSTDDLAPALGRLYAMETLGSTLGGLTAGFLLLGWLGQITTVGTAVVINVGLSIWLLARPLEHRASVADEAHGDNHHQPKPRPVNNDAHAALRRSALIGTFACGFAMLALQVLWFRMFRIYLTNTSYTFALVASLVILGLFAGSTMYGRRWFQGRDHLRTMAGVILLMGATILAGLGVLIYLPDLLMFPFQTAMADPLARVLLLPAIVALLIVFPPAVFSGFAFPLACRMYTSAHERVGQDVGLVLMVNTAGCVMGPIVATFFLLPTLGAAVSVILILTLLAAAALFLLHWSTPSPRSKVIRSTLYPVTAVLVAVVVYHPDMRILPPSFSQDDREVLFYEESVEGTLVVGRDRDSRTGSNHTYINNSAVIGSTYDAVKVVKMVGHLPFLLGVECRQVLVIGFGIGVTTSAIAAHSEVESIECVELVTGLKNAAAYYRDLNHDVVRDPRLRLIGGDGRHYLQRTTRTYDLISCDPTHPILGSGSLYTKEYFALCRAHLNPGGVVSQYLPLHKLRTEEFLGLIATFESVFPHCTVWLGHYHAVLLGSLEPIQINFARWSERVTAIGPDAHFYVEPYHLAATLVLDGPTIERLAIGSRINSDDLSYTEFFNPACLAESNLSGNLSYLMDNRAAVGSVFINIDDSATMTRFVEGNRLLTESLIHQMNGDAQQALQKLRDACRVNPEDQEFPFLIRLYY